MQIHERTSQFGWDGDGGLGLRLIQAIQSGAKTATCCPLSLSTDEEVATARSSVGHVVTVVDVDGNPHCNIRILDVIETPWGAPDERVLHGEGFSSVPEWQVALTAAFQDLIDDGTLSLSPDTVMLAELFELVPDA